MKKNIIAFDEAGYNSQLLKINKSLKQFNDLLDEVNKLDLIKFNSISELITLSEQGQEYIKDRIKEELPVQQMGRFTMKKSASIDMLELPNMNKLDELAEGILDSTDARDFTIIKEKVIINDEYLESLKERFSVIATTEVQARMYSKYCLAAAALSELNVALKEVYNGHLSINEHNKFSDLFFLHKDGSIKIKEYLLLENKHRMA